MIDGRRVLALVPARAGSKGLPGKNARNLLGKPLLAWPIQAARKSEFVDDVVISTDSPEFAALAEKHGARAPFLRPAELASDTASSIDAILHAIDAVEQAGEMVDILLLLEPTSPLTETDDIDRALREFVDGLPQTDSMVGVTEAVTGNPAFLVRKAEDGAIQPYLGGEFGQLPRRQDIEPCYALDGSLYIATPEALRREHSFCHARTAGFEMPAHKSLEVDDLVDFICIEAIAAQLHSIAAEDAAPNAQGSSDA